ncbi:hypothetical protein GO730_04285 [Spirosoma sp. HMF3257]|nr:hypothetical protein [Spirosoma telluris]
MLLLLLISVTGLQAYSQDSASKAFLANFFAKSTRLVYMDKLGDYEIKRMEKALSKDTLFNVFDTDLKEPKSRLVLTKEERSHIQHELAQQATLIWPNQLVENGERLSEAAIDSIERTRVGCILMSTIAQGCIRFQILFLFEIVRCVFFMLATPVGLVVEKGN